MEWSVPKFPLDELCDQALTWLTSHGSNLPRAGRPQPAPEEPLKEGAAPWSGPSRNSRSTNSATRPSPGLPLTVRTCRVQVALNPRLKNPSRKEPRHGVVRPEIPARRTLRPGPHLAYLSRFEPAACRSPSTRA